VAEHAPFDVLRGFESRSGHFNFILTLWMGASESVCALAVHDLAQTQHSFRKYSVVPWGKVTIAGSSKLVTKNTVVILVRISGL